MVVIDVRNISSHFDALKQTFKFGLFWQSFATLISHLGASKVAGFEARDGFLRASGISRQLLPKFESKHDFEHNFVEKLYSSS